MANHGNPHGHVGVVLCAHPREQALCHERPLRHQGEHVAHGLHRSPCAWLSPVASGLCSRLGDQLGSHPPEPKPRRNAMHGCFVAELSVPRQRPLLRPRDVPVGTFGFPPPMPRSWPLVLGGNAEDDDGPDDVGGDEAGGSGCMWQSSRSMQEFTAQASTASWELRPSSDAMVTRSSGVRVPLAHKLGWVASLSEARARNGGRMGSYSMRKCAGRSNCWRHPSGHAGMLFQTTKMREVQPVQQGRSLVCCMEAPAVEAPRKTRVNIGPSECRAL